MSRNAATEADLLRLQGLIRVLPSRVLALLNFTSEKVSVLRDRSGHDGQSYFRLVTRDPKGRRKGIYLGALSRDEANALREIVSLNHNEE